MNRKTYFLLILIAALPALAVLSPTDVDNLYKRVPAIHEITGNTKFNSAPFDWSSIAGFTSNQWQVLRYQRSGHIAQMVGSPVRVVSKQASDTEIASEVKTLAYQLSTKFGLSNFEYKVTKVNRFKELISIFVQIKLEEHEVYGAFMAFTFTSAGDLVSVKGRGFGSNIQGSFSLGSEQAIEIALQTAKLSQIESYIEYLWLPVISNGEAEIRPVIRVDLIPDEPSLRPTIYVDAGNGEVLAAENRVVYDRVDGQVQGEFLPLFPRGETAVAPFPDEFIRIDNTQRYTDANGGFGLEVNANNAPYDIYSELRGRWVNVNYDDGRDAAYNFRMENGGEVEVHWNEDNARLDERGLYFHVNLIHDFWKELDHDFNGMDYPVPATCMYGNRYDNAFWNGQGMFFGDGDQRDNFALLTDVIYHEFGHGVTGHIYPRGVLPYTGESGALNEAWSDYFPCSITDEPSVGEGGMRGGRIRNIDNEFIHNPPNWGEVHMDSRIISAAMWHSREILGLEITDPLFHYTRYLYGNDFMEYFTDVLLTDDDDGDITNGTPHGYTLYEQFGRHGMGPGAKPDFTTKNFIFDDDRDGADGNENSQWEAGETIRLEIELHRGGALFPPPARNVQIEILCDHPDIQLTRSQSNYGDIRVNDRRRGEDSFLFIIGDEAELSFAHFTMIITADNEFESVSTFRIPIGRPPLLLIKDGRNDVDRTPFYEESLDSLDLVYDQLMLSDPIIPVRERLQAFNTVIWFTGDEDDGILRVTDRLALENFLDGGGNLLLTGQSAGEVGAAQDFFRDYMGAENTLDSVRHPDVMGVDGDPASDGIWLLLLGSPGALNQRRPGAVRAIEPAVEIFHWTNEFLGEPAAGVRRVDPETNSKTIYLSFGLEAVSGRGPTDTRRVALNKMLQWLNVPVSVEHNIHQPDSFEILTPYPNPFNSAITLQVKVNHPEKITFSIYDLSGRLMESGDIITIAGLNAWSIDSSTWGSGLYFAQIKGHYQQQTFRLVHLK